MSEEARWPPYDGNTPHWRGVLHKYAVFVAIAAALVLVLSAPTQRSAIAGGVFGVSLVVLFGISSLYHRIPWRPAARAWMKRANHSSIFILIAGTYTPFAWLGMKDDLGTNLLIVSWVGALLGAAPSLFWAGAPHALVALLCVALGWAGVPFWTDPRNTLDDVYFWLLFAGGGFYTVGAAFYALKRPVLSKTHFSYHELFHACTLAAAALHFAAVWLLVQEG